MRVIPTVRTACSALALTMALVALGPYSSAAVPEVVDFQGTLNDGAGAPLTGTVSLTFALYPAATGGEPLWQETQAISVTAGIYSTALGSVTPFPEDLWENNPLWLGVRQEGAAELPQRIRIVAVPYALRAKTAESLVGGTGYLPGSAMVLSALRDDPALIAAGFERVCPVRPECWEATAAAGAPSARFHHTVVWTGSQMVVWGGSSGLDPIRGGAAYDPFADAWTSVPDAGAPAARLSHSAVWTGREMVVWGGTDDGTAFLNSGGRHDPQTNAWAVTSVVGAPSARAYHSAVWTGSRMVVWGGVSVIGSQLLPLNTGGVYDPATDTWSATSTVNAPDGRGEHTAVWTGSRMIVWGGNASGFLASGAAYDPGTDTWSATSAEGAPTGRAGHAAVWTGSRMIVWGGYDGIGTTGKTNSGGRYDPATDTWVATALEGAPTARGGHTLVWTSDRALVWGGLDDGGAACQTGGAYDPATDAWIPIPLSGAPSPRSHHTTVWTGRHMIVWGGLVGQGTETTRLSSGGLYAPSVDRLFHIYRKQ